MLQGLTREEIAAVRVPLARASTLSPRCHVDPDFYTLEVERVFHREWLAVGRVDQVAEPSIESQSRSRWRLRAGSAWSS